jgi:hypothetical protein
MIFLIRHDSLAKNFKFQISSTALNQRFNQSENLQNKIEAFNSANPSIEIGEPSLWNAMQKEIQKVKQVISTLKEQTQNS